MPQTAQETLSVCKNLKEEGNSYFKQKDYQNAISKYSRIMMFAKTIMAEEAGDHMLSHVQMAQGSDGHANLTDKENQEVKDCVAAANLNMSICFFYQKNFPKSKEKANKSLQIKKSIKGYYRRALARAYMKDYDGAIDDWNEAIKLDTKDPNNCHAEIEKWKKYAAKARKESDNKLRKAMQDGLFSRADDK